MGITEQMIILCYKPRVFEVNYHCEDDASDYIPLQQRSFYCNIFITGLDGLLVDE